MDASLNLEGGIHFVLPLEAEHRLQEVQRGAHRSDGCIGKARPHLHHRL